MKTTITPDKEEKLAAYFTGDSLGVTTQQIADEVGLSKSAVDRWKQKQKKNTTSPPTAASIERTESSGLLTITAKSLHIKTLDDLLNHTEVDLDAWYVEDFNANAWEVTTKEGCCYTNYQVKARFKPVIADVELEVLHDIAANIKPRKPIKRKFDTGELLFIPTQFDTHFGKLTWGEETGTDYDIKIAEELWDAANDFSIQKAMEIGNIGKILLPVGSDLFHVNTQANETAKGTAQDVDGRLAKIYRVASMAVIRQIESFAHIAPVEVIPVKGNHDPLMMMTLMEMVSAWFRNTEHVEVSTSLRNRQARMYGDCFIGFDHLDTLSADKLGTVFSTEFPEMWGKAKYRIILGGHWHKQKEMRYVSCDTYGNYVIHVCPSLSGTDAWHYEKGFIGDKITENHVFTTQGKLNTFEVTASQLKAMMKRLY